MRSKTNDLAAALKTLSALSPEQIEAALSGGAKKKPAARRREDKISYLTQEETAALFRVTKNVRDLALLRVAYHRGLRASEIGLLQLADFREKEGRLYVHRLKGSNSGEDVLFDEELRALRAWVKKRGRDRGPLFTSRRRGKAITRHGVYKIVRRQCALAGIPPEKAHPHTLKHTCGTDYYKRTKDIRAVQAHLGHRNIQNTLIYAAITDEHRDEVAQQNRDWK